MSKKKELNFEDLNKITGGMSKETACEYFIQAQGKECFNQCSNCLFFNENEKSKQYECTHPQLKEHSVVKIIK